MKDRIIDILKSKDTPSLTFEELFSKIKDEGLEEELKKLVKEGILDYSDRKGKYLLFENSHLKRGKILINEKGFGFVKIDNFIKDTYIHKSNLGMARNGDIVAIEIDKKTNEGRVVRVIDRDTEPLVGEVYYNSDSCYVKPDRKENKIDIFIPKELTKNAVEGHKVVVKLADNNEYTGEIVQIIGHKNDVGVDILSFVYEYEFKPEFAPEILNDTDRLPMEVTENDLRDRKDLRNEVIFTIDGSDTKDIDDAVSIKKIDSNTYELGVHIADVSYYVEKGGIIDLEAFQRGTSVYLVDRVLPMLPHKLSNGICSLNPNVDRLALSCVMQIDKLGIVTKYEIFESVINSKKKMTYEAVNDILENNIVPEGYEPYVNSLKLMEELSKILRKKMGNRGYIEFESTEPKIIVDEKGHPTDIKLREQRTGENLIENFMVVANETVASHIFYRKLPGIYRVHDKPDQVKLQNFFKFVASRGYQVATKSNKKITSADLQKILLELDNKPENKVFNDLAIRSQAKAVYSKENIGHFGLGSKCYAHFTSPIRRYPDLTLHRLVKDYENNQTEEVIDTWNYELEEISMHSSLKEQDADACERDVEKMKKAEYMEDHLGEIYEGVISGVSNFGLFVELPNTVEGLIKVENMDNDYYVFNEETYALYGKRTGKRYMVGDTLTVKVVSASKKSSTVDFVIIKENEQNEKKESSRNEKKKIKNR